MESILPSNGDEAHQILMAYAQAMQRKGVTYGSLVVKDAMSAALVRGVPRPALRALKREAEDADQRRKGEQDALAVLRQGPLLFRSRAIELEVARSGYAQAVGAAWSGPIFIFVRSLLGTHVAAAAWLEPLAATLLPAPYYPPAARDGLRIQLRAEKLKDQAPLTPEELARALQVNAQTDIALGAPTLAGVCGGATSLERLARQLSAETEEETRAAQAEVFDPPSDIPGAGAIKGGPAPPRGKHAKAREAGLVELMDDVLGQGPRRHRTLASILRTHSLDAERRARGGEAVATDHPLDVDRARNRAVKVALWETEAIDEAASAEDDPDPQHTVERCDLVDVLTRGLTGRQRSVVTLLVQGWDEEEIAAQVGCSVRTVQAEKRAAREHMRERANLHRGQE